MNFCGKEKDNEMLLVPLDHEKGKSKGGRPADPHLTVDQHLGVIILISLDDDHLIIS